MNAIARPDIVAIQQGYAKMAPAVAKSLPSHIRPEQFERAAMVAIQRNNDLLKADRTSLFLSLQRAAQDGLLPDGRDGAIVVFNKQAQWMPMVAGLMKLARNSGEIASITAQVVYEGETFRVVLGDEEHIEHERSMSLPAEPHVVAAYAVATLRSGEKVREIMTRAQIDKVRAVSKAGNYGPWKGWYDEMAKKTVIRRLSKRLPMSTDREAEARLDTAIRNEGVIDGTTFVSPEEAAAVAGPALEGPAPSRLDQMEDALAGEVIDGETGEITQAESKPAEPTNPDADYANAIMAEYERAETMKALDAAANAHRARVSKLPANLQATIRTAYEACAHGIRSRAAKGDIPGDAQEPTP